MCAPFIILHKDPVCLSTHTFSGQIMRLETLIDTCHERESNTLYILRQRNNYPTCGYMKIPGKDSYQFLRILVALQQVLTSKLHMKTLVIGKSPLSLLLLLLPMPSAQRNFIFVNKKKFRR